MSAQARFQQALAMAATRVESALHAGLPDDGTRMARAMRHAVLNGGKRMRAFLVLESAALFGAPVAQADAVAAAIECIHAYSLVHDDLPAMDNDDLRRGLPTVHVKWDDATAVLTGDALQSHAFETLSGIDAAPQNVLALVRSLARAATDMVRGQYMDIAAETALVPLDLAQITDLQAMKTGALIRWSAGAGAVLTGNDPAPLYRYAEFLGQAFQIRDDILDIEGDSALAGKRLNKDAAAGKATFVSLLGLDGAKARAADLVDQAVGALDPFGARAENLRQAALYTITRAT